MGPFLSLQVRRTGGWKTLLVTGVGEPLTVFPLSPGDVFTLGNLEDPSAWCMRGSDTVQERNASWVEAHHLPRLDLGGE